MICSNLIMRNIKLSYPNYSEFSLTFNDWINIVDKLKKDNSKDSFLKQIFYIIKPILHQILLKKEPQLMFKFLLITQQKDRQ